MPSSDDLETSSSLLRQVGELNNNNAWMTFVQKYKPFIQGCCHAYRLERDALEEVTQVVLVHLVKKMRGFVYDPSGSFRGWLSKLVRRKMIDFFRNRQRRPGDRGSGDSKMEELLEKIPAQTIPNCWSQELDAATHPLQQLTQEIQARVQAQVNSRTWQAFWLCDIEGIPTREVAEQLGLSIAGVHMARQRVRRRLQREGKKVLEAEEPGESPPA